MKVKAAIAVEAGKPLEVVEIDVAPPRKGEVLIRVTHTGVCHTDLHAADSSTYVSYNFLHPVRGHSISKISDAELISA